MKLNIIISFMLLFSVFASGYAQEARINLDVKTATTVKSVLKMIEEQTKFRFLYNPDLVDLNRTVTVSLDNKNIHEVLKTLFSDTSIGYCIMENNFVVLSTEELLQSMQGIIVTGTVTDADGVPLPGVNVVIKGTQQGTVTDTNGAYSLQVPNENATLVFSFMGYATQEFVVGDQRNINAILGETAREIEEVVVIGYGTTKRRDLTGATGRVNASDIQNKPSNNVMDFLRGTVAGFNSTMNTSAKGGGSMEIRGTTSITANSDPLIVVDGMIYNGDIADINPADIESIDILKDGSSAAVYGTRAAAGVLAITTKRGLSEKPVIDFNASWGVSQLAKRQEVYDGEGFIIQRGDSQRSMNGFSRPTYYYRSPNDLPPGVTSDMWLAGDVGDPMTIWLQGRLKFGPTEIKNYLAGKTINWQDEVFRTGLRQDYNIGVGGKTKMTNYYFSLGYLNNQGIIVGDKYQNIRSRLNLTMDVTNWFQVGTNLQFSNREQGTNPASYVYAADNSPFGDKFEEDGKTYRFWPNDDNMIHSPFRNYVADMMDNNTVLIANLFANIQLPLGIKYQVIFNNQYAFRKNYSFYSTRSEIGKLIATSDGDLLGGSASRYDGSSYTWQVDNIFTWNKTIADIHRLDATFLINAEKSQLWSGTTSASQFMPSDILGYHQLGIGLPSSLSILNEDTYATGNALMGRINYTLMDKYLLTASYRRDGYSAFGKSNPYAYFPAVAVAWRLSEESFMNGTNKWLDYAKIRLSWGINGNRDIGIYSALASVITGRATVGGNSVITLNSSTLANNDLKWEKTTAYNAGLDFSIFKNILSGSIDGYMSSTKDLLLTRALPPIIAYSSVIANLGEITNRGMEVTLQSNNLKRENLSWHSTFTFSFNRNRIEHLYGNQQDVLDDKGNVIGQREADDEINGWYIGQALDRICGYEFIGIWQESEREEAAKYARIPGDVKLRDVRNFEGRTEFIRYEEDRVFQGYTKPRYRLGLKNDFTVFKNFNLSFFLRADLGHYASNKCLLGPGERFNGYKFDYWTPENPINTAARPMSNNSPACDIWVKRSFMRLQDVSFSYTLPTNVCSTLHLQSARVFINMNNLLTVCSSRILWDPETVADPKDNPWGSGAPTPRIFSLGINITL